MNPISSNQNLSKVNLKCSQPKFLVVVSSEHLLTSPSHVKNQLTRSKEEVRMFENIQRYPVVTKPSVQNSRPEHLQTFQVLPYSQASKVTEIQRIPLISDFSVPISRPKHLHSFNIVASPQVLKRPEIIQRFPLVSNPYVSVNTPENLQRFRTVSNPQFSKVPENFQRCQSDSTKRVSNIIKINSYPLNPVTVSKKSVIVRNSSMLNKNSQLFNSNPSNSNRFPKIFNGNSQILNQNYQILKKNPQYSNQRFSSIEVIPQKRLKNNPVFNRSLCVDDASQVYKPPKQQTNIAVDIKTLKNESKSSLALSCSVQLEKINIPPKVLFDPLVKKPSNKLTKFSTETTKSYLSSKTLPVNEDFEEQKILPGSLVNEKFRGRMVEAVNSAGKIVKTPVYMQCDCIS